QRFTSSVLDSAGRIVTSNFGLDSAPNRAKESEMNRTRITFTAAAAALATGCFLIAPSGAHPSPAPDSPETITLTGIVRDFKELSVPGGHPDFEVTPSRGFAHYCANVSTTIGADNKPVFTGGGHKVTKEWTNAAGKNLCYSLFDPSKGDKAGTFESVVS